jgi:peptidoglycan/LPS O-acetylase OafA/YrhL
MHVWSIPVEFKGSMVVFASLLALSRCNLTSRLWCQLGLIGYFMYIADGWYCAMFVAGMLLSHLDLLADINKLPDFIARFRPFKTVIFYHMLAVGIYLGGVPCENRELDQLARNRGWYFLSFLKPQAVFDYKWFYLFWAAILLVTSVSNIAWLKRFFETRVCQYLGRISFALYLVHGPLLWTLGDRLYAAVGFKGKGQMEHIPQWVDKFVLPQTGPVGLEFAFLLPHLILLPITLCMADLVTRAVDQPSVQFSAWVYRKTQPSAPRKHSKA